MHRSTLLALGLVAGQAVAETVHGVVVFSRHGDRTSKHYSGYGLTSLGASQNFQVGSDYRARYLEAGLSIRSWASRLMNTSPRRSLPVLPPAASSPTRPRPSSRACTLPWPASTRSSPSAS
uniref:Acid phosphatase n=1 Tax=Bionectria ochroleuca TaxID=29856 RepID=A0A8H7NCH3_BIOOC